MLRICRQCATQYEGDPGSTLCPDCVAKNKKSTIRDRTCRECGIIFPGGPRAWYCPSCRAERAKEASRRHKQTGPARLLGSTDICTVCGGTYTVTSGRQRYCPNCAPEAIAAVDREQGRRWNAENLPADQRRTQRQACSAPIPCKVCGKLFVPDTATLTCSPECRRELNRQKSKAFEAAHREERNAAQRERRKQKEKEKSTDET